MRNWRRTRRGSTTVSNASSRTAKRTTMPAMMAKICIRSDESAPNSSRFAALKLSAEQSHESRPMEVGNKKDLRIPRLPCHRLRREISAADSAFHGCRPPSRGPVSGKEQARPRGRICGPVSVDARHGREGSVHFFDHRGLHQICITCAGEKFAELTQREINNFLTGFVDQTFRRADDELDVAGRADARGCSRLG